MATFHEEAFEVVPKFDEQKFDWIVNIKNEARRRSYTTGETVFITHVRPGQKAQAFDNLRELPANFVKAVFSKFNTSKRPDGKAVLTLEFDVDTWNLELSLQYLLACVNEGKYADVEVDPIWAQRIMDAFKVVGAEQGITRMVQSAASALRKVEFRERQDREAEWSKNIQKRRAEIKHR